MEETIDFYISADPMIRHLQIVELVLSHCYDVLWPDQPFQREENFVLVEKVKKCIQNIQTNRSRTFPIGTDIHARMTSLEENNTCLKHCEAADLLDPSYPHRQQKSGFNGLHVASADVIVLKNVNDCPEHRVGSHHPSQQCQADMAENARQHWETQVKRKDHIKQVLADGIPDNHTREPSIETISMSNSYIEPSSSARGPSGRLCNNTLFLDCRKEEEVRELSVNRQKCYCVGTAATTFSGEVVLVTPDGHSLHEENNVPLFEDLSLRLKRLSGGITNELFHVYRSDNISNSVVVRIFGKETERVISRESELFYQSFFLKTYAHGSNFLIYEFLDSYEPLPYAQMAVKGAAIAETIAAFHVRATWASRQSDTMTLSIDDVNRADFQPNRKLRCLVAADDLDNGLSTLNGKRDLSLATDKSLKRRTRFEREANYTIHSLTKWVELIVSEEIIHKVSEEKQDAFRRIAQELCTESEYMVNLLEPYVKSLGEGVCHNDLLSANFMQHVRTGRLKIIDFDYTKRNFLLFDLANHFNEYTGLECDYAKYFPSDQEISTFVRNYRRAMRAELERTHAELGIVEDIIPNERAIFFTATAQQEDEAIAWSLGFVKFLTLYSHLSWSIWSLLQEAVSSLDVDFLEYGKLRLERYHETKENFSRPYINRTSERIHPSNVPH